MDNKRYKRNDFIKDILSDVKMWEFKKSDFLIYMNSFIYYFQQALINGYTVDLRGIGVFSIKKIPAREQAWNVNKGRRLFINNHNEPRIKFPPTNSVRYKPSIKLRKLINEPKPETILKKEVKYREKNSTSLDEKSPNNSDINNKASL